MPSDAWNALEPALAQKTFAQESAGSSGPRSRRDSAGPASTALLQEGIPFHDLLQSPAGKRSITHSNSELMILQPVLCR